MTTGPLKTDSASAKRYIIALLIAVCALVWQWRFVVYAPAWLMSAYWADRSDLYSVSTNGISNRALVEQARKYLTDIDHADASGKVTAPEALRPLRVHLDIAWFARHSPVGWEYDPLMAPKRPYTVTWDYVPGCQEAVWDSSDENTDWYDLRGRPCHPAGRLSIVMASDLRLTSITFIPI
jgi:hypothetical protein